MCPEVYDYIARCESGDLVVCDDQLHLCALLRRVFAEEDDIVTDEEQLRTYLGYAKYFGFELYPWEALLTALHLCTYRRLGDAELAIMRRGNGSADFGGENDVAAPGASGRKSRGSVIGAATGAPGGLLLSGSAMERVPRWPDMLCMVGRGSGKDGKIALDSMCLTSEANGIRAYDVDICANNEDQAMRPVKDFIDMLELPEHSKRMTRFFYWTKEHVLSYKTRSLVKGRTNSPKGKDGLRSGAVIFNEIHQYQDYLNIDVFTTGLGKKPHPRRSFYTTNGNVRMGPLDDYLEKSEIILRQGEPDGGWLPFICRLNRDKDVHEERCWQMATPSLPYNLTLLGEVRKEYAEWCANPQVLPAFMAKRMNRPGMGSDTVVTEYENISATKKELPDLRGRSCVVGIDYASISDFASVVLHFREDNDRFDIQHSWLCTRSKDIPRMKAPLADWERDGHLSMVDDVEIAPELLCDYIERATEYYDIRMLGMDNFRFALFRQALAAIGFDPAERKNVKLVRPSDVMKVEPVISSAFANGSFIWGDSPMLRWGTNNTKRVRSGKLTGTDTGNYYYAKIEGKSRKTDPFMALVAAMVCETELDGLGGELPPLGII